MSNEWDDATKPGGDFLKAEDIEGETKRVKIVSITMEEMTKFESEDMEMCFLAHFAGTDKVLKMNKTNRIYLKEQCGIKGDDNGGIASFEPFPVVLYKREYTRGTAVMIRLPDDAPLEDETPF